MSWTRAKIRQRIRTLTKDVTTSDSEINDKINDFYHNRFPMEVDDKELNAWYDLTLGPTDSGDYDVSDSILKIYGDYRDNPVFIDNDQIKLWQDSASFFECYPRLDMGVAFCQTSPTLVIGSVDSAKVGYSAFSYKIAEYSYYIAAGEVALEGDDVPEGTYGAWRIEVDEDGTVSATEADDNDTGYDTAAQAILGLSVEDNDAACMGFVTAISSSGDFVPGTTALDDSNVTDTYTDGYHSTRNIPDAALLEGSTLYIRSKPNDIYTFRAYSKIKPTIFSDDTDTPSADEWGPVIALGVSLEMAFEKEDTDLVNTLTPLYDYEKLLINRRYITQFCSGNQRAEASF